MNTLVLGCLTILAPATSHAATVFLVGAQVYASGSDGTNVGSGTIAYQYSTNSGTEHEPLIVNGVGSAISFLLSSGDNIFAFSQTNPFPIGIVGLNLFFNTTGTSYNPSYVAGAGLPGDLAAFVPAGSSAFSLPAAGINVQSYNSTLFSVNTTSYSGTSTIDLGGLDISITALSAVSSPNNPAGSFTITVAPAGSAPEPASFALMGGTLVVLAGSRRVLRRD